MSIVNVTVYQYVMPVLHGENTRMLTYFVVAGDQFGNYLIQYILMNANPQHREVVASHVR
jgi:hypothetical protein